MLVIPQAPARDLCDGITRRDLLRVGGSAVFGLSLANLFGLQKAAAAEGPGGGLGPDRRESRFRFSRKAASSLDSTPLYDLSERR